MITRFLFAFAAVVLVCYGMFYAGSVVYALVETIDTIAMSRSTGEDVK